MSQLVPTTQLYNKILAASNTSATRDKLPEILFITSYPPRECGIATYSNDLINALNQQFSNTFAFSSSCKVL